VKAIFFKKEKELPEGYGRLVEDNLVAVLLYKLTIFLLHCVDLSGSSLISLASKDYTHIDTV